MVLRFDIGMAIAKVALFVVPSSGRRGVIHLRATQPLCCGPVGRTGGNEKNWGAGGAEAFAEEMDNHGAEAARLWMVYFLSGLKRN